MTTTVPIVSPALAPMSSTTAPMRSPTQQHQQQPSVFEFTKRKRWADLLITELADAVTLILSPTCDVLYCGTAVNDLLGWKEADLVDANFADFLGDDDKAIFRTGFYEAIRAKTNFLSYVRLKCQDVSSAFPSNSQHEMLFEVTGRPHFERDDPECKCFLAMAKPYPSRNTSMLNTFIDLKLENDRLQRRLRELKINPQSTSSTSSPSSSSGPSLLRRLSMSNVVPSQSYPSAGTSRSFDEMMGSPIAPSSSGIIGGIVEETDLVEEGIRKKKAKKNHATDQHVCITCGRTDSPEWRKGPLGPKTLCNACGLRWAKQMRKTDDGNPENAPDSGGGGGGMVIMSSTSGS